MRQRRQVHVASKIGDALARHDHEDPVQNPEQSACHPLVRISSRFFFEIGPVKAADIRHCRNRTAYEGKGDEDDARAGRLS
jgi:hypothetical protein